MKLPALIASDLHLTANPEHEYRWGLFKWITEQIAKHGIKTVLLLGDITEAKDYHGAELVNKLVRAIEVITWMGVRVVILRGNHDYLREGHMFFEFMTENPKGCQVITQNTVDDVPGARAMFLPFTRDPVKDWAGLDLTLMDYVFIHQTIDGAVSENGTKMDGDSLPMLIHAGKVYSGDIHVPQMIGAVEYVGAPYHVRFGDNFKPRCVLLNKDGVASDLHYPSPRRVMVDVDSIDGFLDAACGLKRGDQVKVRLTLPEAYRHDWRAIKADVVADCTERGLVLSSVELKVRKSQARVIAGDRPAALFDPKQALYSYVDEHELGVELLEAALLCME